MVLVAAPLIKWDEVGKIVLAGLVGAVGVVVVYGFLLLAVSRARSAKHRETRIADYALAGVCGAFCVAAVAIGIYAVVNKPKSSQSSSKGRAKIALATRAGWSAAGDSLGA